VTVGRGDRMVMKMDLENKCGCQCVSVPAELLYIRAKGPTWGTVIRRHVLTCTLADLIRWSPSMLCSCQVV